MGIVYSNAAMLAREKQRGTCFDNVLTIGHLTLYLSQHQIATLIRRYGLQGDPSACAKGPYADDLFMNLFGARHVQSLDFSDHENCDILHDMNLPIDPCHHEQFDVVIDGGSLEHVFNFPVAIANCMNMLRKGGHLFVFTMANNHAGHGFYQFSPELFYRILQPENGFEVREIVLESHQFPGAELSSHTTCYSVVDPADVKTRVGLVSSSPVMMMVHAVKTENRPLFSSFPIQSDYAAIANRQGDAVPIRSSLLRKFIRKVFRSLPVGVQNMAIGYRQLWHYSFRNRQFYRRWKP